MNSHTPAPWSTDPDFPERPVVIDARHHTIAECGGHGWDEDTERANAARIAACVNAFRSVSDPAGFLLDVREALRIGEKYACVEGTDDEIAEIQRVLAILDGAKVSA